MKEKPIVIFIHCFPPTKDGLEYLIGKIKKILGENYLTCVVINNGFTPDS